MEATITKATVLEDQKPPFGTVLLGVAEYGRNSVNFLARYDWNNLDVKGFLYDLKEKLAKDLNCPMSKVDVRERRLVDLMQKKHEELKELKMNRLSGRA